MGTPSGKRLVDDVPDQFRRDVRAYWAMLLVEVNTAAASGSAVAAVPSDVSAESVKCGEVDGVFVCESMIWMVTYYCVFCLVPGKALAG